MKIKVWQGRHGIQRVYFWCPGCEKLHGITAGGAGAWTWNGDLERPTVQPSVLAFHEDKNKQRVTYCHLFLREGRLQFLDDCRHALAGKTVDLIDMPSWAED